MDSKKCSRCTQIKPAVDFDKNGKYLKSYCKVCYLEYKKIRYQKSKKATYSVTTIDGEIWGSIDGFDGFYQVSNMGRIKSLARVVINGKGAIINVQEKILKPRPTRDGYLICWLRNGEFRKGFSIHRLVAISFVPNPMSLPEVNHKGGLKSDNRATELEWMTSGQNQKHAYDLGLRKSQKGSIRKYS